MKKFIILAFVLFSFLLLLFLAKQNSNKQRIDKNVDPELVSLTNVLEILLNNRDSVSNAFINIKLNCDKEVLYKKINENKINKKIDSDSKGDYYSLITEDITIKLYTDYKIKNDTLKSIYLYAYTNCNELEKAEILKNIIHAFNVNYQFVFIDSTKNQYGFVKPGVFVKISAANKKEFVTVEYTTIDSALAYYRTKIKKHISEDKKVNSITKDL